MDLGQGKSFNKRVLKVAEDKAEYHGLTDKQLKALLKKLDNQMYEHARNLEFEQAAQIRDEIENLKKIHYVAEA